MAYFLIKDFIFGCCIEIRNVPIVDTFLATINNIGSLTDKLKQ